MHHAAPCLPGEPRLSCSPANIEMSLTRGRSHRADLVCFPAPPPRPHGQHVPCYLRLARRGRLAPAALQAQAPAEGASRLVRALAAPMRAVLPARHGGRHDKLPPEPSSNTIKLGCGFHRASTSRFCFAPPARTLPQVAWSARSASAAGATQTDTQPREGRKVPAHSSSSPVHVPRPHALAPLL